jgi:hypothetical protein
LRGCRIIQYISLGHAELHKKGVEKLESSQRRRRAAWLRAWLQARLLRGHAGEVEGVFDGSLEGKLEVEGVLDGSLEGMLEVEGVVDGSLEGILDGSLEGMLDGAALGLALSQHSSQQA